MLVPTIMTHTDPPFIVPQWSDGTDVEIAQAMQLHYAGNIDIHDYWTIGDERTVSLSSMSGIGSESSSQSQTVVLVLTEVGGKTLTSGAECAFQVDQKNCLLVKGCMNTSDTNNGGWDACARRSWCNDVYYNALPEALRGIFKQFYVETANGGNSSSSVTSTDYFALRAEKEVFGSNDNANSTAEARLTQIEYYKTSTNLTKTVEGAASNWWLRSPYKSGTYEFCLVYHESSGSNSSFRYNASYNRGIAPFGCI